MSDFCKNFNIQLNLEVLQGTSNDYRYCPEIGPLQPFYISSIKLEDGVPCIYISGLSVGVTSPMSWGGLSNPNSPEGPAKVICSPLLFGQNPECKPYVGVGSPYGAGQNPFIEYVLLDKDGNKFSEGPNYTPGPADDSSELFGGYDANGVGVYRKRIRGEIVEYTYYSIYQHTCDTCIQYYPETVCIYSSPNSGVLKIKDTGLSKACGIELWFNFMCGWPGAGVDMTAGEISEIYASDITQYTNIGAIYAPEIAAIKDSSGKWIYSCGDSIVPKPTATNVLFNISSLNKISSNFRNLAITAANLWSGKIRTSSLVLDAIRTQNPTWNGIELTECIEKDLGYSYIAACTLIDSYDIIENDIYDIKFIPLSFSLEINTFFLNNPKYQLTSQDWLSTLMHELGHALGVGYWKPTSGPWLDGSEYEYTRGSYRILTGGPENRRLIPIEDSGEEGTIGAHWENMFRNETYPNSQGFVYPTIVDIMLPFLSDIKSSYLSTNLSVPYLIDQGFIRAPLINNNNFQINNLSNNISLPSGFCGFKKTDRPSSGLIDLKNNTFTSYR